MSRLEVRRYDGRQNDFCINRLDNQAQNLISNLDGSIVVKRYWQDEVQQFHLKKAYELQEVVKKFKDVTNVLFLMSNEIKECDFEGIKQKIYEIVDQISNSVSASESFIKNNAISTKT